MWEGLAGINLVMGRSCLGFLVPSVLALPARVQDGAGVQVGDWGCSKVGFMALWGGGLPSDLWDWECKAWGCASPGCGTAGDNPLAQLQGQKSHCPAAKGMPLPALGLG